MAAMPFWRTIEMPRVPMRVGEDVAAAEGGDDGALDGVAHDGGA